MNDKITSTIGVFAGILHPINGKLLLRRREKTDSITGESFRGNYELVGGAVTMIEGRISYHHLPKELEERIKEKIGIDIKINPMPISFPILFEGPKGCDLAMVIPVLDEAEGAEGEIKWVSPQELEELGKEFISETEAKEKGLKKAKGIVSGYGKRMFCMSLKALQYSPFTKYKAEAEIIMNNIQSNW